MGGFATESGNGPLAPEELERYANAVVQECLRVSEGDTLVVHAEPAHRALAVALAAGAYRAGAAIVDVQYADPRAAAARARDGREEDFGYVPAWVAERWRAEIGPTTASVTILGEAEEDAWDGVPAERAAALHVRTTEHLRWLFRELRKGKRRWCAVAWPTTLWASRAYPELPRADGLRRLAQDLLRFCRFGPDDPHGVEGWKRHAAVLGERGRALSELDLRALEIRAPGTLLDLKLAPGTRWLGGPRPTAHGHVIAPNFPTEENFTSPDAAGTEGSFRCSRPLAFRGRVIEGIAGEFHRGRLVRLEAANEDDRELLAAFLYGNPGATRLGEVALVDRSSRIGQTGRTYFSTLLDENAAAHMAFGSGFSATRVPDPSARGLRGVNRARFHLDVMIGTDELEATGTTAGGRRVPLVAGGEWQV